VEENNNVPIETVPDLTGPDLNVGGNVEENIPPNTDGVHDEVNDESSESGGHRGYISEDDEEFIRQLDEVLAEIGKTTEGEPTPS